MTSVVPNYFIEKNDNRILDLGNIYCINYITKYRDNFLSIRNTMHAIMIPIVGQKIITTKEMKIDITSSNICFLYQNNYFLSKRVNNNLKYKSIILFFNDKFVLDFIKKYELKIDKSSEIELFNFDYDNSTEIKTLIKSFENYLEKDFSTFLLRSTDKSISQIASSCGYSNTSWFISEFKKRYYLTPKEYRYKI